MIVAERLPLCYIPLPLHGIVWSAHLPQQQWRDIIGTLWHHCCFDSIMYKRPCDFNSINWELSGMLNFSSVSSNAVAGIMLNADGCRAWFVRRSSVATCRRRENYGPAYCRPASAVKHRCVWSMSDLRGKLASVIQVWAGNPDDVVQVWCR